MKIEYDFDTKRQNDAFEIELRRINRENTIGCLITGLFLLITLFVILALLPFLLIFVGWMIIFIAAVVIYKLYLESPLLNFIQKIKMRRNK